MLLERAPAQHAARLHATAVSRMCVGWHETTTDGRASPSSEDSWSTKRKQHTTLQVTEARRPGDTNPHHLLRADGRTNLPLGGIRINRQKVSGGLAKMPRVGGTVGSTTATLDIAEPVHHRQFPARSRRLAQHQSGRQEDLRASFGEPGAHFRLGRRMPARWPRARLTPWQARPAPP